MIIYRYIIKEHILPFLYSLGILIFIFAMQLAVQMLDKIISKGLDMGVVLEIFVINIAWVMALAIPMAILVATLMAFGAMSGNNEIMALKASGRNIPFLLTPVFLAACVLTILSIYFNNDILPDANHRAANLLTDISRKKPAALIEPGVLITSFENYALYVKKVNATTGELSNVKIFSNLPGEDPSTTVAEHGELTITKDEKLLQLTLYNGETHRPNSKNPKEYFIGHFSKQLVFIKNIDTQFRRTSSSYRGDREMSSEMLLTEINQYKKNKASYEISHAAQIDSTIKHIDSMEALAARYGSSLDSSASANDSLRSFVAWMSLFSKNKQPAIATAQKENNTASRNASQITYENKKINSFMVEVHKKYAIPIACLVFVLIGAPLGIMARRGGIMVGASYSLFFFILFWAFLITGENMADDLIISPFFAMWTADILLAIVGFYLIFMMTRETKAISFSFITKPFSSLFKRQTHHMQKAAAQRGPFAGVASIAGYCINAPYRVLSRVIGILPTYLLRKFVAWFIGLLLVVVIVFIAVDWVSNLRRFDNTSLWNVALYYWYYLPWLGGLILPIVILLAAMSAIGSMVKVNELTAVKAAGMSVRKLSFALVVTGLLLAGLGFYISEGILPKANTGRRLLKERIDNDQSLKTRGAPLVQQQYRRNFYYFGDNNTIYHFDEFRTDPCLARNAWRQTFSGPSLSQRISAESANYKNGAWYFIKGIKRTFLDDGVLAVPFDTLADTVLKAGPTDMVAVINSPEEMSYWELSSFVNKVRKRGEDVSKWDAQLDFKIALPLMNFIVMLLGVSISARAGRRGGAALFGIGLLLIFAYWILSQFAIAFAQNGQISPMIGAWLGNIIFLAIALPLYRRASL